MRANVAERLLQHYVDKSRVLPWRSPPGSSPPDPYRTWISEVMLQQTTVAAVVPRFERFLKRWPTIQSLAAASDDEVLNEWAGLGYYARARNLIACARQVADRGTFPHSACELRKLPGIGDYTAAAIAAIAFGCDAVAIDSNVERVVARLDGLEQPRKAMVRERVETVIPTGRFGDFAQAAMDLGATVCRPRKPLCGECPLQSDCSAFATGDPERFPRPKMRKPKPVRYGIAWWIERSGAIWLVRRPERGLLGGMAALPGPEWSPTPASAGGAVLAEVRHVFTHFALELSVVASGETPTNGWWQRLDGLSDSGLPTLYRRAIGAIVSARIRIAA